jgi:hypothetical protein
MNNSSPKLLALDIDGTILDKNFNISERLKTAVLECINGGVQVVVATGRMYSATVPIAKELALTSPLIVYQGSLVQEFYCSEEVLLHHTIEKNIAYHLIEDLKEKGIQINVYFEDKLYVEKESQILLDYVKKRDVPFYKMNLLNDSEKFFPTKILGLDYDIEKINKIRDELKEKYKNILNITKSTEYFIEFVNKECSKASAILFLAERFGINPSEIMSVGDQDNDKEMLLISGIGVAMGNGDEELKKIAHFVTHSVENDGAAVAIEKFILNRGF